METFDNSTLPGGGIEAMMDLPLLRKYSETTRDKWSLIHRVIVARSEHHDQFYAGGDEGHCSFVDTLYVEVFSTGKQFQGMLTVNFCRKAESNRLETLLRALDKRAYTVSRPQIYAVVTTLVRPLTQVTSWLARSHSPIRKPNGF